LWPPVTVAVAVDDCFFFCLCTSTDSISISINPSNSNSNSNSSISTDTTGVCSVVGMHTGARMRTQTDTRILNTSAARVPSSSQDRDAVPTIGNVHR
jgi:hypothetical protein